MTNFSEIFGAAENWQIRSLDKGQAVAIHPSGRNNFRRDEPSRNAVYRRGGGLLLRQMRRGQRGLPQAACGTITSGAFAGSGKAAVQAEEETV